MATLRAGVIIYTDLQLVAQLSGLSLVGYCDLYDAARSGRPFPLLYKSGVMYQREPPGSEVWQSPKASLATKRSDCEDLAAGWRVPELWLLGETKAAPYVKRINPRLRHILVQRADGSLEDPSIICGMHAKSDPNEAAEHLARVKPVMRTPDYPLPFGMPRWNP